MVYFKTFNPWTKRLFVALLAGFLYVLGYPSLGQPPFFLFPIGSVVILFGALGLYDEHLSNWDLRTLFREKIPVLLAFSFSYTLAGYYWLPYLMREFGGIPFPFDRLMLVLFSLFVVPHLWGFLICVFLLKKFSKISLSRHALMLSVLLVLCEQFIPQQFPAHLGHSWASNFSNLFLARILGAPFFSFVSYYLALGLLGFIKFRSFSPLPYFLFIGVVLMNLLIPYNWPGKKADEAPLLQVRIVQANIGNFIKLESEKGESFAIQEVVDKYRDLSLRPTTKPLDLIIWPETAYPFPLQVEKMLNDLFSTPFLFRELTLNTNAQMLIGGYTYRKLPPGQVPLSLDFETIHNSALHLDEQGKLQSVYNKHYLIPFGETIPLGPLTSVVAPFIENVSFFARGENFNLFKGKKGARFISAICYELLFSSFIRNQLSAVSERPHFILNLTNDSWYGDTIEPYQHLFLAKWRALEFGLPIIRSTNTGITSVIWPDGSESRRILPYKTDTLDVEVPLIESSPTVFERVGLWGFLAVALGLFLLEWAIRSYFREKPSFKRS